MKWYSDYIKCNLADNFFEIKANNIAFLKGELMSCYSSMGIEHETFPVLDKIIEINRLGLITTVSQPGVMDALKDYYQRCYISGMFHKSKFEKLKSLMSLFDRDFKVIRTIEVIDDLIPYYNKEVNDPPEWHVISKDSTKMYTHTIYGENVYDCQDFAGCRAYPDIKDCYYTVEIVDLKWGRTEYMFDCLIEALKYIKEQ